MGFLCEFYTLDGEEAGADLGVVNRVKGIIVSYYKHNIKKQQYILQNGNHVPRVHVSFGQQQDTELWNNQQARSQSPGVFCF